MNARLRTGLLAVVAILAIALPASAQIQRGAIYGTIMDNTGAVLPGVTVTLSSAVKAPHSIVSGAQGEFRFGELDPGVYTITASMDGFAPFKRENIIVSVGSNIQLPVQMALAGVQQQVTVTAPTPVLDERAHGNTTTFGEAVLNEIPTARDPWVLAQQVPGVLIDRINVGGSESGQQSAFQARGDSGTNTMWNIDGVTITDMGAVGSTPTYYDFDMFQEVQFTTGSLDPRQQTGALGINMVTRRGTNDFHGMGRFFFDDHSLQTGNLPSNIQQCPQGHTVPGCLSGNKINQITDYGANVGGPIMKDKLWFWGSIAKNDIREFAITGAPDNTLLKDYAVKADFQATASNHADFMWFRGNKEKFGRNAGVTRPPETTWNQGGPTDTFKFEDSHTFGSHLMVTGRYAHVKGGFFLDPQGGLDTYSWQDQTNGVNHGSYYQFVTQRPQDQVNADGNYFRGMHELKVGFQYRRTPVTSTTQWPNQARVFVGGSASPAPGINEVQLFRGENVNTTQSDKAFYVGDTIALKRVTIDAALRYDRQVGNNGATTIAANPILPNVLPAVNYPGAGNEFTWNNWSPRVGATFHLNDKTIARASYALYEAQLPGGIGTPGGYIAVTNAAQTSAITYYFADDGSHVPTAANIDTSTIVSSYGFDPANPTALTSPYKIDPNFKAPRTHAVIVGLDRELIPNFALSTSFGFARTSDQPFAIYQNLTQADFVPLGTTPMMNGVTTSSTYYGFDPALGLTNTPPILLTNRQGYHTRYWNWDVTATKRLADRWMFRGYFTLQNNQEYYDNPSLAIQDPTPLSNAYTASPGTGFAPVTITGLNGGIVINNVGNGSGSHGDVFIMSKWQYNVMGLYQFGWGIQASGTVYGRQGYPSPIFYQVSRASSFLGNSQVLVSNDLNAVRNPNVHILDLRAEKSFKIRSTAAILSVDLFNVTNSNTVLQVNRQLGSATYGDAREIVAPRIFRFGARFTF